MTIKKNKVRSNFDLALAEHYTDWNRGGYSSLKPLTGNLAQASTNSITVRPEFNLQDYYELRPNERIADKINDIMLQCEEMYYKTGILRSIVELMSEFVVDGLEILHEDPEIQEFYQTWAKKVNLVNCAEQLTRHLYRSGNAVIRRTNGKINVPEKNQMMDGITIAGKTEINYNIYPKFRKSEIPIKYCFYRPSSIELVGGDLGAYSDKKIYGLRIPNDVFARLQYAKTDLEKQVWNALPADIKKSLTENQTAYITYPLPSDSLYVACYKKDDMDIWAYPIIYSILPDLILNQKVKIAKGSALDGWYNFIRVWKLGDHTNGILPPRGAAEKLNDILSQNSAGGPLEIIWDSMIDVQELYPPIEKFNDIHEDKSAILEAFGIPEELAGGISEKTGGNNTAIKTKNFAKKLDAGRREVNNWLLNEIQIIHRNMKFDKLPYLRYNNNDLMDEKIFYTLLRELKDRRIISDRTMIERIGEIPAIERQRVMEEQELVNKGKLPPTASPFHNPNLEDQAKMEMDKIKLQTNLSNEVKKKVPDPKKPGRPGGSKDRLNRRRTGNTGRTYAITYASELWDFIDNKVTESYLAEVGISNVRLLTNEQKSTLDSLRTYALVHTPPGSDINDNLFEIQADSELYEDFTNSFNDLLKELPYDKINNEQKKMLKFCAYAEIWSE